MWYIKAVRQDYPVSDSLYFKKMTETRKRNTGMSGAKKRTTGNTKTAHRSHTSRRRRRRRRMDRQGILLRILPVIILVLALLLLVSLVQKKKSILQAEPVSTTVSTDDGIDWFGAPEIDFQMLTVNPYSRPGIALKEVKGIVVHYTANPGSSAQANRNYFEGLKDSGDRKVSSHFVIGIDGEIIQCVPTKEIAYASNKRNSDTVSIECCHKDETGEFTKETYDSLVQLTAWLCKRFSLDGTDVIRHYDVTGKDCPRYYVAHEDEWKQFQTDVETKKEEIIQEEKQKS